MIIWHRRMYCDEKVNRHRNRYIRKVEKRRITNGLYLVTLPLENANQLEIYRAGELWFEYNRRRDITVVGLAADRESAKELVERMLMDALAQTGKPEIRHLFEEGGGG